jgi:hypothetical protein
MKTSTKLIIAAGVVTFVVSLIVIIVLMRKGNKEDKKEEPIEQTTPTKGNSNALMLIAIPFAGFIAFLMYKLASRVKSTQNVLNSQEPVLAMQRMNRLQKTQEAVQLMLQKGIQNGRRNKLPQKEILVKQVAPFQGMVNSQQRAINARGQVDEVRQELSEMQELTKQLTALLTEFNGTGIKPVQWVDDIKELFNPKLFNLLSHPLLNVESTKLLSYADALRDTISKEMEPDEVQKRREEKEYREKKLEIQRNFQALIRELQTNIQVLTKNIKRLELIIQEGSK